MAWDLCDIGMELFWIGSDIIAKQTYLMDIFRFASLDHIQPYSASITLYFLMLTPPPPLLDQIVWMSLFPCTKTPGGVWDSSLGYNCLPLVMKERMLDTHHSKKILLHRFTWNSSDRQIVLPAALEYKSIHTFSSPSGFSWVTIVFHQNWWLDEILWSQWIWWHLKPNLIGIQM